MLNARFDDYASHHTHAGNRLTHALGIPLIVLSLLGLLSLLPSSRPALALLPHGVLRADAGVGLWFFAMLFYVWLDWKLAAPFSLFTLGLYFVGRALPVSVLVIAFVLGWVLQGVGHAVYEKRAPAFTKNLEHLLIGPFWLFAKAIGYSTAKE